MLAQDVLPLTSIEIVFRLKLLPVVADRRVVALATGEDAMTDTTDPSTLRRRRHDVVVTHLESENAHDFDTTIGTFSHPRYELVPTGQVFDGEIEVRQYFAATRTAFPDLRNEVHAIHHADDAAIVEFDLVGTHQGPLLGFAPTGRSFRCRMAAFFLFDGDRIVCERVYYDLATMMRQLGLA